MKHSPLLLGFSAALLLLYIGQSRILAQDETTPCTSFTVLSPDVSDPLGFTVPIAYGSFADVELAATGDDTVQLEVEVLEDSAILDRRIRILVPGRVELLTEALDVENLLELGSPILVRMRASEPVSAVLVRRDAPP